MENFRIGVVGAGIIGRTHIQTISRTGGFRLTAIVEPGAHGADLAEESGARRFTDVSSMAAARIVDGVIVAAPNEQHVPLTTELLEAGLPVLLEKPIADTSEEAEALLQAQARTGAPLLVGHHRRHNPIIQAAKAAIDAGRIGELRTASVLCSLYKDTGYFDVAWRRRPGVGGPLLINLIHEIDLLRHLFGEVDRVSAFSTNAARGLEVEDTAAAILRFENGGLASLTITDAGVGPWGWDIAAGENLERFPAHPVQTHFFAGSEGGLSLPDLVLWTHDGEKSWSRTLRDERLPVGREDVYSRQLAHFGDVIAGRAEPLVSGREAANTLNTIMAIKAAAQTGVETPVRRAAAQ